MESLKKEIYSIRKMFMLKQLRYDFISGILHHKKRMLILAAVIIGIYIFDIFIYKGFLKPEEFIKFLFRGMMFTTDEKKFVLPNGIWLGINILLSLHIGMIISDDISFYGKLRLLKLGNKIQWWLSKVVLVCVSVILYYVVIIVTALICANIAGLFGVEYVDSNIVDDISTYLLTGYVFKIVLTSLMLSCIQGVITLFNFKIGIAGVVIFLAVTMYDRTHRFFGNYLMIARMKAGIEMPIVNMTVEIVLMVFSIIIGMYLVKRKSVYIWR